MIAQLRGTISSYGVDSLILDVAGVGYRVHVTLETLARLRKERKEVLLWSHLAVRETSLELYGFLSERELLFFEMLISISGIGPKSGCAIMNLESVETLSSAIRTGDTTYLTKVSGIGRKSAEKIIIELRDKITSLKGEHSVLHSEDAEALEALQSLGYSTKEARAALKLLPQDLTGTGERLTQALKHLGK